ncbi:MAG: lipid kinase YegS [Psychromonas sp.]|nr:lipid kinase YegS [Psychromonas sp.]
MQPTRLILNGKKAGLETVRSAIFEAREQAPLDVRVTWEAGDVDRLVKEAYEEGCSRLIVGGGDGSVKEVVDALMKISFEQRPALAILPLGTANDFSSACTIPNDLLSALTLAQTGTPYLVDCIKANQEFFINVASGGFGAQVTRSTPPELKNFLGGGAYTLHGLVQALKFTAYTGEFILPKQFISVDVIAGAICNGRQAGGGQILAPKACIDDGLLDIVALTRFPVERALQVIDELLDPDINGEFVKRFRAPWAKWQSLTEGPTNLDGEGIMEKEIFYEVIPKSIKLILPKNCPLISV